MGLVDSYGREQSPDAYFITLAEARFIIKSYSVLFYAVRDFISIDSEELKKAAVREKIKDKAREAFKKERVNVRHILNIADRLQREKYWTLRYCGSDFEKGAQLIDKYKVEGTAAREISEVTTKQFPDFFSTKDPAKRAQMLGIRDGLYFPDFELNALLTLEQYCNGGGGDIPLKDELPGFWSMKSSPILDALGVVGSDALSKKESVQGFNGGLYKITISSGVKLSIGAEQYNERLLVSPNVDKLINQFNHKAFITGFKDKCVDLTLNEIMEARQIKDRKEADVQICAALEILSAIMLSYENETTGDFKKARIIQAQSRESGRGHKLKYSITYSDAYFDHLRRTQQVGQLPSAAQAIPNNKGNAYSFLKAFCAQQRRNAGKKGNIENKLRVKTLLSYSSLSFDSLKDKAQAAQLIIKPFTDSLDYLEEQGFFSYEFQYSTTENKGEALSEADLARLYSDYNFFSSLVVAVKWINGANYSEVVNARDKKRARKERQSKG